MFSFHLTVPLPLVCPIERSRPNQNTISRSEALPALRMLIVKQEGQTLVSKYSFSVEGV